MLHSSIYFLKLLFNKTIYHFSVTLKDIKGFLPRINYKISTCKLREAFQEVNTRKQNEIGFDDFSHLHCKLIFDENVSTVTDIIMNDSLH